MTQFSTRLLAVGVAVVLTGTLIVSLATAHSLLLKSEPENETILEESPEQVIGWFSQELETGLSSIRVFNDQGGQVDNGDGGVDLNDPDHTTMIATLPGDLVGGRYTVRWTAVSVEDGDVVEGMFTYSVASGDHAGGQGSVTQPSTTNAETPGWTLWWIVAGFAAVVVLLAGLSMWVLSSRRS